MREESGCEIISRTGRFHAVGRIIFSHPSIILCHRQAAEDLSSEKMDFAAHDSGGCALQDQGIGFKSPF